MKKEVKKCLGSLEMIADFVTGTAYSDIKKICKEFEIFSGSNKIKKIAKLGCSAGAVVPPYVLMHELMHAGAAKLLGADKIRITLDNYVGGGLLENLTSIKGENLFFEKNCLGYCSWQGLNKLEETITFYSPYLLTPIGISLMYTGLKKKNLYLTGAGMLVGIKPFLDFGFRASFDLSKVGMNIYDYVSDFIQFFPENPGEATRIICMAGVMAGTYAVSKGIVKGFEKFWEINYKK